MTFDDVSIVEMLSTMDEAALDGLPFGVVGLDGENMVELYNAHEEHYSGLPRGIVAGRHFFSDVAPCMNNYMVAERLEEASLNDTYGHAVGDAALRAIARVLQTETHEDDLIGRLGGEEFAVMMPTITPELAEQVAERLRAGVAALQLEHEGQPISPTVSIGIAEGGTADLKQLLINADAALYDAKRSGHNCVSRSGRVPLAVKPAKPLAVARAVV